MKNLSFCLLAILSSLVFTKISFAHPEQVTQIALQDHQKKALTEKLADQADKYAGEGKYAGHGAWSLDRIKTDLKSSLERAERWVKSHLTFHFHATQAASVSAPAASTPAPRAPRADDEIVFAMTGPELARFSDAAQHKESHENNISSTETYFETRRQAIENYTDTQQIIEAHQQAIQDVAKSGNYLFAVTNYAVEFNGTYLDSMVLVLTAITDLALLPLEFLACLFTGF